MRLRKSPPEHRRKGRLTLTLLEQFCRVFTPDILYCEDYQLSQGSSQTVMRRLPPPA